MSKHITVFSSNFQMLQGVCEDGRRVVWRERWLLGDVWASPRLHHEATSHWSRCLFGWVLFETFAIHRTFGILGHLPVLLAIYGIFHEFFNSFLLDKIKGQQGEFPQVLSSPLTTRISSNHPNHLVLSFESLRNSPRKNSSRVSRIARITSLARKSA